MAWTRGDLLARPVAFPDVPLVTELISRRSFATEAGTERFVRRHGEGKSSDAYRTIGHIHLSSLGIGTYLGGLTDERDDGYRAALVEAVRQGVNVIDTASNYRAQRSERVVGEAIAELIEMREVYRSELMVASKAGFVPFDHERPEDVLAWIRAQTVDKGLADPTELCAGCHCMAPAFIDATIHQSLQNTGLETIDLYYLHNPETQLQQCAREDVEARIREAFRVFERAADEGRIRVYGVATWSGLRALPEERDHLSLERLVALAEEVAGTRHRLKAIQLPLNPLMPEAFTRKNQRVGGTWMTALQAAEALGLLVFVSGPLFQGRLGQAGMLAKLPGLPDGRAATSADVLRFARSVPGVTTALAGMSRVNHVRENVRCLHEAQLQAGWRDAAVEQLTQVWPVGR